MPEYRRAWHPGGAYFFTMKRLDHIAGTYALHVGIASGRYRFCLTMAVDQNGVFESKRRAQ